MSNLSVNQLHVLSALISEEMYGLELVKYVKECGGRLNIGSLYNLLSSLEKNGYLEGFYKEATESRKGNRRRYYRITASGEEVYLETQAALQRNWGMAY